LAPKTLPREKQFIFNPYYEWRAIISRKKRDLRKD